MSGETSMQIIGNLCSDLELTYTPAGVAVAHFTVASTPRYRDPKTGEWRDKDPLFLRCNLWRETAENAAATLSKGSRVILMARLKQRSYQTRDGEQRTVYELDVDEIDPSLRWARATLTRTAGNRQNSGSGFGQPDRPARQHPPAAAPSSAAANRTIRGRSPVRPRQALKTSAATNPGRRRYSPVPRLGCSAVKPTTSNVAGFLRTAGL